MPYNNMWQGLSNVSFNLFQQVMAAVHSPLTWD
jgi:hypothetical protein